MSKKPKYTVDQYCDRFGTKASDRFVLSKKYKKEEYTEHDWKAIIKKEQLS